MFHSRLVYDKKASCQSRVCDDFQRVVNLDEKGNEKITFEKIDYPKLQNSLGAVDNWDLKSLLAAGIDPDFRISTGFNTRLEGASVVEASVRKITEVIDNENKGE